VAFGPSGHPQRRTLAAAISKEQVMFERFTDRARRVIVLAQEEARLLNHNYIGTARSTCCWA